MQALCKELSLGREQQSLRLKLRICLVPDMICTYAAQHTETHNAMHKERMNTCIYDVSLCVYISRMCYNMLLQKRVLLYVKS